jgi:hypothetical protein
MARPLYSRDKSSRRVPQPPWTLRTTEKINCPCWESAPVHSPSVYRINYPGCYCAPSVYKLYFANFLAACVSELALQRYQTFHVTNFMPFPTLRSCITFYNMLIFYVVKLLTPSPTQKLKDPPPPRELIIEYLPYLEAFSSIRNLRTSCLGDQGPT